MNLVPGNQRLRSYLLGVGLLGCAAGIAVILGHPQFLELPRPGVIIPLVLVLIVGELFPIVLSRAEGDTDEVSISSTVGIALILVAPLGIVLSAQTIALLIDEGRRRHKSMDQRSSLGPRLIFNVGQYALSFIAARAAFSIVSGTAFITQPAAFSASMLPAAWVAAIVFYLTNTVLTNNASALATRAPMLRQLFSDTNWQVASSVMLLGLAPVYAQAVYWSPWLLPFLLFPLVVVHRGAAVAAERGSKALHDPLTGLPNRVMLQAQLNRRLEEAGAGTALLLIDLDHFKDVNDTLGHHVGDDLIRSVSVRLQGMLREDDLLARLGGDEFAIICGGLQRSNSADQAQDLAQRISTAMQELIVVNGVTLQVGCSIGVAVAPDHGDSVDLLLQHADVALYTAKEHRGGYAVFDPSRNSHALQRLVLAEDLRRAILGKELRVAFQPQMHARTRVVTGVEALVRWTHPVIGTVDPERVISLATSTGLMSQLTAHLLDQGLRAIQLWDDQGHQLRLSINLTARQLSEPQLATDISSCLAKYDISPARLSLEVSESTVMNDAVRSIGVLDSLKELGVEISIDDFGTGRSSLAHLQRLAPHELKIDRSFVVSMATNEDDRTIVRSTIELGHNLGLRVLAEGVEDGLSATLLGSWGCDVLQGYYFSVPREAAAMSLWLGRWRNGVPSSDISLQAR